jgi:hypothetical protein
MLRRGLARRQRDHGVPAGRLVDFLVVLAMASAA